MDFIDKVMDPLADACLGPPHRISLSCRSLCRAGDQVIEREADTDELLGILGTNFAAAMPRGIPVNQMVN